MGGPVQICGKSKFKIANKKDLTGFVACLGLQYI